MDNMKLIAFVFLIYAFIKSMYYGIFEIKEKQNKPGGYTTIFLAILGLILPMIILLFFY